MTLLALLAVITYLDRVCISVAGPRMQEALRIGPVAWGWVTGVFTLSYAAFEIPSGALGDRIGPRRVLTRIVLWWSAFTSLTGLVTSYPLLLLTRFCFGMGEAGAYPNASVAIGRWFPLRRRTGAWGTVLMASQIGGAISPLLVVPIQMRYGWRASFFLFGIVGVVWGIVWFRWFHDSPAEMPRVSRAEIDEIGPSTRPLHGLPWTVAIRSANFWSVMGMSASYGYTLIFFQTWMPTYLVRARGFSETGLLLGALPFLVGACSNLCGGLLGDALVKRFGLRWGRRSLGLAGLGSAACFLAAAGLADHKYLALIFLSLAYGGITLQQPGVLAVCLDIGGIYGGAVTGAMNTAGYACGFLSSIIFGYLVNSYGNYNVPFIPMVALLIVGAFLWLKIDPTREVIAETQPISLVPA